jgi:hypothetical protein
MRLDFGVSFGSWNSGFLPRGGVLLAIMVVRENMPY